VKSLLEKAAASVGLEEPIVQILELGDFSVTYRAAGILRDVKALLGTRAQLRVAILDQLHAAGIEIVSPDIRTVRTFEADNRFISHRPRAVVDTTP